jgi:hypothetical protein
MFHQVHIPPVVAGRFTTACQTGPASSKHWPTWMVNNSRPRLNSSPGVQHQYQIPAIRVTLREMGRLVDFLDGHLEWLDEPIIPLVTATAALAAPAC